MATESTFKLTYATMFNPPEELHTRFDEALAQLKAKLGQEHGMIIDGKERFANEKFEDRSPINTDWVLGIFQKGTAQDAKDAIAAAKRAFPMWSHTPWQERVALVRKAADIIDRRIFEMGAVMALEVGKNRMEALGDVAETADLFRYSCEQMEANNGYIVEMGRDPLVGFASTNVSILRPYGVWLVISPFNFPAALTGGPAGRGAGDRQYHGDQTRHRYALDGAPDRGVLARSGRPGWCVQLRHRAGQHARPGADRPSGCGRGDLYRLV